MSDVLGIGIIGCGNIAAAYMRLAPMFRFIQVRACADLDHAAAQARAAEFGLRASTVEALLASDDIDIIINLTVPAAHYQVSASCLSAGKHVYSEKPYVLSVQEGSRLAALAAEKGLRIGSAPDTFLGGAHQFARHMIDTGTIGRVTSGTCFVMSHGMEHWHPNPDFFYSDGAGPLLDVGPYYVTNLIQLIGPVRRVAALSAMPANERTISSQPRSGERIPVSTPTTIHGLLEFHNGAVVSLATSWDVWAHDHAPIELYGEAGSLSMPDPNYFGGTVKLGSPTAPLEDQPEWDHPFAIANVDHPSGRRANYRAAGLAEMAQAILSNRPHRCNQELALHAVEVMTGLLQSGENGQFVTMQTTCDRPEALNCAQARDLLR